MRSDVRVATLVLAALMTVSGCGGDESSGEDPFADSVTVEGLQDFVLEFHGDTPLELDGAALADCAWSDDEELKASVAQADGAESAEVLECAGADGSVVSIKTFADPSAAEDAALGELFPTFHYGEIAVSGPPNREQREAFHIRLLAECECGQVLHSGMDDST